MYERIINLLRSHGTHTCFTLTRPANDSAKPVISNLPIELPVVDSSASVEIYIATPEHFRFAQEICLLIKEAAAQRGTGIARRAPEYIREKMAEGKAVIALGENEVAGFCYIETWDHGKYAVNSGLIVSPKFRKKDLPVESNVKPSNFQGRFIPKPVVWHHDQSCCHEDQLGSGV